VVVNIKYLNKVKNLTGERKEISERVSMNKRVCNYVSHKQFSTAKSEVNKESNLLNEKDNHLMQSISCPTLLLSARRPIEFEYRWGDCGIPGGRRNT
jgi:hypothetical protein